MPNVHPDSKVIELLAPAGSPEAFRAAVHNGADAVYLGVEELNARRGAENFALADLADTVRYAHVRGVRVYLTANVVIKPEEMASALGMVAEAWAAGVDAVIVHDLGLARVIRQSLPEVRLHASTQIGAHEPATVAQLERLGFARVTLAREVALDDVASLVERSEVELEVFAHGALCICYSGQCLLSSVVGGRSANRGMCAQPCRLPYEMLDEKGKKLEAPGRYLLSPKDLCTVDLLPRVLATGVSAIKIEGRMKSPEYVAVVTRVYRDALDRAAADPEGFSVTEAEHASLSEAFSRGFTTGHLDSQRGEDLMGYARPNNRGVPIGRVTAIGQGRVTVDLDRALDTGDVLEFWTKAGRFTSPARALAVRGADVVAAPAGARVELTVDRAPSVGDRVFRVVSASLEAAARRTFVPTDAGRTVPTRVQVRARIGEPLAVVVEAAGARGEAFGAVVEPARTKPLTAADIMEHVGRLGGTAFLAEEWDVELDPGAGMGFSALHAVRREAIARLEETMLLPWSGRRDEQPSVPSSRSGSAAARGPGGAPKASDRPDMPEIVVWTTRLATARACMAAGAHRAIVPAWALAEDVEVPAGVSIESPRVAHVSEFEDALAPAIAGRPVVATTLGLIAGAHQAGSEVWAHWGLNATNQWTVAALSEVGAAGVWLSPEVSGREVARIVDDADVPVGIAVLGRQEVMVMEHCVISPSGRCSRACDTCPRRERWYALKDRKGYGMPVIVDPSGRSHVYNAVPLDLTRALDEVVAAGVAAVRLDFTVEHIQHAQRYTKFVREALEAVIGGRAARTETLYDPATAGHFFRGVS